MQFPIMFVHPSRIKVLWTVKALFVPPAVIGFYIWMIVKAGGYSKFELTTNPAKGGDLGWGVFDFLS